uniref:Elongation of very long chain fatty acids protein n=1 Tax=Amphilophus citrinellus TaxID=61819 RepID=A0A3Q0R5C2_AMPCI
MTALTVWQRVQLFYQGILENGDKRTDNWLLVYSPVPISCVFLCYLIIIWVGPKLMAKRRPANLRPVLIVYNFAMVCLSAYMFYEFTASSWLAGYSLLCQPVNYSDSPSAMRMARVCWWFFVSKVIELCDSIFFILRKKNSQVTFLHVYHHATVIFSWWAGVKYVAGGQSFLIGLITSLVHVVMYLYYALAAVGPSMIKYLWWKRHLTTLQLVSMFTLFFSMLLSYGPLFMYVFQSNIKQKKQKGNCCLPQRRVLKCQADPQAILKNRK